MVLKYCFLCKWNSENIVKHYGQSKGNLRWNNSHKSNFSSIQIDSSEISIIVQTTCKDKIIST